MPSLLEDPTTYIPPPPSAQSNKSHLKPLTKTLKDSTPVTLYPIANGPSSIPDALIDVLHREFSAEIARGTTYPMEEPMGRELFANYWFGTFAVIAVAGEGDLEREGRDWERECLGTFYVKPNYPGRCSHVCNAGFLTTEAARGRGVGIVMGETYLDYAPKLGYKYSVFNLVFENNVASVKIWERLGFQIIGRVPGAARLSNSTELVDALIIGRELV
ncbi:putative acetyltransferase, GNAT family [Aspergillus steynii IBT 23096]|uniref:Putative acetyltransferase, GNAT family n=1 Tax=Aspergillus steynii IBT 23096 TaxID=1392250 RepID=A0A2I2GS13_9EURO|nr:putative acetyltransferase, GNAT family [Aspergillus steynii IBT 23096]PLB55660.1 putative acetyltransferase, GNAT family [Aspergillus steynii IBT 23096]